MTLTVPFPRVLGIEAVGTVAAAPGSDLAVGSTVATAMGGMGRMFGEYNLMDTAYPSHSSFPHIPYRSNANFEIDLDGGYAEYTCVPAGQVQKIDTKLGWETLGALPEMLQTAWGSLFKALQLKKGERLLVYFGVSAPHFGYANSKIFSD